MSTKTLSKIDPPESALATNDPVMFAVQSGASVDVIERMMAVRRELKQEAAKEAFDRSMAAFQAACPNIKKTKAGAKNAYKFAPLDHIIETVKPLLLEHGFSYSIDSKVDEKWVEAIVTVTHTLGHSVPTSFKVPVDNKNPMMTEPQRFGGAMTFSKRYCFCNAFGILTADEDTDAQKKPERFGEARTQTAPAKPSMTPEQIRLALHGRIWDRLAPLPQFKGKTDEETWGKIDKWIIGELMMEPAESFESLPNDRLERIATAAEEQFDAPGY